MRVRIRSQRDVVERCRLLRSEASAGLARLPEARNDPDVVDAVWCGEALGTLLWALKLAELPAYDRPFATARVVAIPTSRAALRSDDELDLARETARLWHWRARTTGLQAAGRIALPPRYTSFDQLIAATAMRGHDQGVLPAPFRGDFRAYGKTYRHLSPSQRSEAHSIAAERHHALNWICGFGRTWDDVPLDT